MKIGDESLGRISIGLFGGVVPKTAQNFFELATMEVFLLTKFVCILNKILKSTIIHLLKLYLPSYTFFLLL